MFLYSCLLNSAVLHLWEIFTGSLLPGIYFRSLVSSLSCYFLCGLVLRSVRCWHGLFLALLKQLYHCFSLLLWNIYKDIVPFCGQALVDIELLVLLRFVLVPHFPQKLKVVCISAKHVTQEETILNLYERVTCAAWNYKCWII